MAIIRVVSVFMLIFAIQGPVLISSLSANVARAVIYTHIGENEQIEIFCSAPPTAVQSLSTDQRKLCRFYNEDRTIVVNVTDPDLVSVQVGFKPEKFSYYGKGVNEGECGLKIKNIATNHIGKWACHFVADDIWTATISVLEYESPTQPQIHTNDFEAKINVTDFQNQTNPGPINISCCTLGGVPIEETKLSFYLGGIEAQNSVLKKNSTDPSQPVTCIEWNATFHAEDNEKLLVCKVIHPALKYHPEDSDEIQDSIAVNVFYRPRIVFLNEDDQNPEFITKRIYHEDKVDLYFTIQGNPLPIFDLSQVASNTSIETGEVVAISEKQVVTVHNVTFTSQNNSHNFIVTIDAPSERIGNVSYEISFENYLGRDAATVIVSPPPGENNSTFWIVLVVGVVMSLIFIGIIVYFLNSAAEKRGWLCYKGKVRKYPVKRTARDRNGESEREHEYCTVSRADNTEF